jgi:hypothetical protein
VSNSTPPGWYPDPHVSGYERFWDGRAWTERRRPLVPAHPAPSPVSDASPAYGHPAVPEPVGYGYGYEQAREYQVPVVRPGSPAAPGATPAPYGGALRATGPGPMAAPRPVVTAGPMAGPAAGAMRAPRRSGSVLGLLAGSFALVMVTAAVCAAAFKGSSRPAAGGAAVPPPLPGHAIPSATAPADPGGTGVPTAPDPTARAAPSASPGPSGPPVGSAAPVAPDGGSVQDLAHGWSIPLPPGWTSQRHDEVTSVLLVTSPYDCATPGGCVRGNFSVDTAPTPGSDPQQVARQAIVDYAPQLFGPLADHQELVSGPIGTAGRTGYAVRWHVTPKQGAQGYVLLVALPGPGGCTVMVGSVDDDPQAPKPEVLEQLVAGVKVSVPANSA